MGHICRALDAPPFRCNTQALAQESREKQQGQKGEAGLKMCQDWHSLLLVAQLQIFWSFKEHQQNCAYSVYQTTGEGGGIALAIEMVLNEAI